MTIGLGGFLIFCCGYWQRLTRFAETRYGMGRHVWVIPPEHVVLYMKVRGSRSRVCGNILTRCSRSTLAFSFTILLSRS